MAAQRGDARGFQAGRPAADDCHFELLGRRLDVDEPLVPDCGVDGAAHVPLDHEGFLPAAHEAGDAFADLVLLPVPGLVGPLGVSDHLAGKADHVRLPFREDLLAVVGITQGMAGDDGHLHVLLDLFRGVGVPALRIVHRVHRRAGQLEDAGADVQVGDTVLLEEHCRLDAFLKVAAALDPLFTRIADANREVRAALVLDGMDDLQGKPHAPGEAAAETVVSLVHIRAHELGNQVSMGAVQLHAIEARLLHPPRPFGELLDELVDLLHRHCPDGFAMGVGRRVDDLMAGRGGDVGHHVRG